MYIYDGTRSQRSQVSRFEHKMNRRIISYPANYANYFIKYARYSLAPWFIGLYGKNYINTHQETFQNT